MGNNQKAFTVGYLLADQARELGMDEKTAQLAVAYCEGIPEDLMKKLTYKKAGQEPKFVKNPGRCRMYTFEISPTHSKKGKRVWKGVYNWARFTVIPELYLSNRQIKPYPRSVKERFVDTDVPGADPKGEYPTFKKEQLRIWTGLPNKVKAVPDRFRAGCHQYAHKMVDSGQWDGYYMPPVAPVDASRGSEDETDADGHYLWHREVILDVHRIFEALDNKKRFLGTSYLQHQLEFPKNWGPRESFRTVYTLCGKPKEVNEKEDEFLDEVLAITGLCIVQHCKETGRTTVVFIDTETLKWWLSSFISDRCNKGVYARFGNLVGLPTYLIPEADLALLPKSEQKKGAAKDEEDTEGEGTDVEPPAEQQAEGQEPANDSSGFTNSFGAALAAKGQSLSRDTPSNPS